jgi:PKD repeat protein
VHTYLSNGSYSVSLTVSNQSAQSSVTKEGLVQAGVLGYPTSNVLPEVSIYPVPADRFLVVGSEEKIASFTIFDQKGKEIMHEEADACRQKINIEQLAPGVYNIRIKTAKGQVTKAFIVNQR